MVLVGRVDQAPGPEASNTERVVVLGVVGKGAHGGLGQRKAARGVGLDVDVIVRQRAVAAAAREQAGRRLGPALRRGRKAGTRGLVALGAKGRDVAGGEQQCRRAVIRVVFERFLGEGDGRLAPVQIGRAGAGAPGFEEEIEGRRVAREEFRRRKIRLGRPRLQHPRQLLGHVGLDGKHVLQGGIVAFRPHHPPVAGPAKFQLEMHRIALASHAAAEDVGHPQPLGKLGEGKPAAPEPDRRGGSDDLHVSQSGERGDQFRMQAVRKGGIRGVGAEIFQRQDDEGMVVVSRDGDTCRGCGTALAAGRRPGRGDRSGGRRRVRDDRGCRLAAALGCPGRRNSRFPGQETARTERGGGPRGHRPRPARPHHHRAARLEFEQIGEEGRAVAVALRGRRIAGPEHDLVQAEQDPVIAQAGQVGRQLGKLLPVESGGELVKHFAEGIDVSRGRARTFGRHVAFRADEGARVGGGGDESDVGELRHAVHENHVRRLDIAVHESVGVQAGQHPRQLDRESEAVAGREAPAAGAQFGKGEWHVGLRIDRAPVLGVVGQFHHVVEEPSVIVAADVQQRELDALADRHRGEFREPFELPVEGLGVGKPLAPHELHGAVEAGDGADEPHVAVAAAADLADERVVGNRRAVRSEGPARAAARAGAGGGQRLGEQALHVRDKVRQRPGARRPRPGHREKGLGHEGLVLDRGIEADGHDKGAAAGDEERALFGQMPLEAEIAFVPRLGLRRHDGHEQRAGADLLADSLIRFVAAALGLLVEPHLDARGPEGGDERSGGGGVGRRDGQEHGFARFAHAAALVGEAKVTAKEGRPRERKLGAGRKADMHVGYIHYASRKADEGSFFSADDRHHQPSCCCSFATSVLSILVRRCPIT